MSHRDAYERFEREKAEMAIQIRSDFTEMFNEYAERALLERRYAAASAFQLAAALVRGTALSVGEPRAAQASDPNRARTGREKLEALKAKVAR